MNVVLDSGGENNDDGDENYDDDDDGGIFFPFTSELQWFPGFLPPLPWPWGVETMMIINEVLEIYWVYMRYWRGMKYL